MTAALIIAAGRRSGREAFDPGRKVGTISAIQRIGLLLRQAGVEKIVVCGGEEVKKLAPSMDLVFLPSPTQGEMLHNIQAGLAYLQPRASQVLVCHVGVAQFSVRTVQALLEAPGDICVPGHGGCLGHPILLRQGAFPAILAYRGEGGLKGAIRASGLRREIVAVDDPGIHGSREERPLPGDDLGKLRLSARFKIGRETTFYGPGAHQLLLLTQELESLSEACKYMGISYSKGRHIIQNMEEQLGCPVLESRQGGRGGGSSRLTAEALELAKRYEAFRKEAEASLQGLFERYFS